MKFGINLTNFGPGCSPATILEQARQAEALGFGLVMMSDHAAVTPDVAGLYAPPFYDPLATLPWLAGLVPGVELGTTVLIAPLRHPLITARLLAQIDRLSGGRLIVGAGAGWAQQEYEAMGVEFARRGAIMNEYLAAMIAFWTQERASFSGRTISFEDVATDPRPLSEPHPPLWIGGRSSAALRRCARFGDAWHPNRAAIDWLRSEGLPELRAASESMGRTVPAFAPRIDLSLHDHPLPEADRRPGHGSVDQVRADVGTLAELGAVYVVFDPSGAHDGPPSPHGSLAAAEILASSVVDPAAGTVR